MKLYLEVNVFLSTVVQVAEAVMVHVQPLLLLRMSGWGGTIHCTVGDVQVSLRWLHLALDSPQMAHNHFSHSLPPDLSLLSCTLSLRQGIL